MDFDSGRQYVVLLRFLIIAVTFLSGGTAAQESRYVHLRMQMVERDIVARGISNPLVLNAMLSVPRHLFVPINVRRDAYADHPLRVGYNQTISQPYIVALMTELLQLEPDHKILEIGTGSGYQAAVLASIVDTVFSVEIIPELTTFAQNNLKRSGITNVVTETRDGYRGWPAHAPFDGVIVTAAPDHVPQPLIDQLKPGGVMVIPVGDRYQELVVIRKSRDGRTTHEKQIAVRFVPMTGEAITGERQK
jgi:protein-L-isoaspartate(D-aspartate) O-methyltransferase